MKRLLTLAIVIMAGCAVSAQSNGSSSQSNTGSERKILIAYYSWLGNTNALVPNIDGLSSTTNFRSPDGNTNILAQQIHQKTGGAIFVI
jgi:hypothetical protein